MKPGNNVPVGVIIFFKALTFDFSCMAAIEVGIMYDQSVKGIIIKI